MHQERARLAKNRRIIHKLEIKLLSFLIRKIFLLNLLIFTSDQRAWVLEILRNYLNWTFQLVKITFDHHQHLTNWIVSIMTCISRTVIPFRMVTFDVVDTLIQFRTAPGKQYGEFGAMFGVVSDNNLLVSKFKSNWCVD